MTLRPLQPTQADLRKWRRLIKQVRALVANPAMPSGDLKAATATARRAVAPTRALLLSCCSPLVRLCEAWPTLSEPCRPAALATLTQLTEVLAEAIGEFLPPRPPAGAVAMPVPAPVEDEDDLFEARPPRRDVYG